MLRYAGILLLSFASVAARAQEENPLHWAEKEQGVRAAALRERIEKVRERIRAKGLRVHALEVSPNPLANFWEDDQDTGEARVKVQKLLRLSLRGQMQELESLQRLLAEVESEREWIRAQLAGELPAAKLGNADGSMVLCGGLPVEGKG